MDWPFQTQQLDGVWCHHRTPRSSTQGPGGVTDRRQLNLSLRGSDRGLAAEHPEVGGGTDNENRRGPDPRRTSTATGDKDRVLDDGASVHVEWDISGGAGMD